MVSKAKPGCRSARSVSYAPGHHTLILSVDALDTSLVMPVVTNYS
jgi:hypothetical protein